MRPPAFYIRRTGGWHDYINLLHLPYLLWHLSYVTFGAVAAPEFSLSRYIATLSAFALAVGISSHAFDELRGRPLGTQVPAVTLWVMGSLTLAIAAGIGLAGAVTEDPWLVAFVVLGAFIAIAYNLEVLGGRFHNRFWFATAWGAFPVLTAYWAQTGRFDGPPLLIAVACLGASLVQTRFSRKVKLLRRGSIEPTRTDAMAMRRVETGLCAVSVALPVLAGALVMARA